MFRVQHGALASALLATVLLPLPRAAAQDAAVPPTTLANPATPTIHETLEVTATRLPEDALEVPAEITVISGEEIAARNATTLADALALVAGVSIGPGGDGGPASSVPELMGLREFDAFLLVVDDVPWGGAFNPALPSLDLTAVDRIEVVRGSAPVLYGATSFVGVIHVIHRAPGAATREARVSAGRFGSYGASVAAGLPAAGGYHHTLVADGEKKGFRDDRAGFDRAHLLYRGLAEAGGGHFRIDLDASIVDQGPASPHPREGRVLSTRVPLDANHNPADARIDEDRFHLVAGYSRPAAGGDWATTLAFTHTKRETVRCFLAEELDAPPGEDNAFGYRQDFDGTDVYFDSHLGWHPAKALSVVAGVDYLFGRGKAESEIFGYRAALDGSSPQSSAGADIIERPELEDERGFGGLYAQAIFTPAPRWRLEVGLRLNSTTEKQEGEVETEEGEVQADDKRTVERVSGSVGASFRVWGESGDAVWLFADYRDSYKPAAVDFGPEAEGEILKPETADAWEAGVKGRHGNGRLTWQAAAFHMDFANLVIGTRINGLPALINAGEETFKGFELEGNLLLRPSLRLQASYSHHDARFGDFVQEFDGVPTQLDGNRLEMSPDDLAAFGLLWAPATGLNANVVVSYVGERYLTKRNTAVADPYTTWSAGIGYRFGWGEVRVDGENLNDERAPVSESELGDAQYYLLPARSYDVSLRFTF